MPDRPDNVPAPLAVGTWTDERKDVVRRATDRAERSYSTHPMLRQVIYNPARVPRPPLSLRAVPTPPGHDDTIPRLS